MQSAANIMMDAFATAPEKSEPKDAPIVRPRPPVWIPAMDGVLKRYFGRGRTAVALARQLHVSVWAVRVRARKLGLRAFHRWTPAEDDFLRTNYRQKTAERIGWELNRKADAVRFRVRALGLRKRARPAR